MSKKKQYLSLFLAPLGLALAGCVVSQPLPDLGECADTEGLDIYDYGQVGIGTCLAGPTDIAVVPGDGDDFHLLAVNSNFEVNFRDGSLVAIPFSGIDLDKPTNYMHEVGASAVSLPTFPAGVGVTADGTQALVSARTANKLMGEEIDRIYAVDLGGLSGGGVLAMAERGEDADDEGRTYTPVPTDPFTVIAHPETGLVYVLNLTTHEVTVLDESVTPIDVLDVVGGGDVSDAVFEDVDGSGSNADFQLDAFSASIADDETWEIRYLEGTTSLFLGEDLGDGRHLWRLDASDNRTFLRTELTELDAPGPGDWSAGGYGRATVVTSVSSDVGFRHMWVEGLDADGVPSIGATQTVGDWSVDWSLSELAEPVLDAQGSDWQSDGVGDPAVVVESDGEDVWLFYTAHGPDGRTLGVAVGDGREFDRSDNPILEPADSGWDSSEVYGPSVYRWDLTDEDLLYYTGSDGSAAAIGLAIGHDGTGFERYDVGLDESGRVLGPGEAGTWDSASVAYPTVFQDAGLFHMFYAGTDGETWAVGHATSFDGVRWLRDPANPVVEDLGDGVTAPVLGAVKSAPGDYFRVEGSVTGPMTDLGYAGDTHAWPGLSYINTYCPMIFTVTDRQLLGRGDGGDAWEDGSGGPTVVEETDGTLTLYYETVEDSLHLLGEATSTDGQAFDRVGGVAFADGVEGLEGAASPAVLDHDGVRYLAFHGWRGEDAAIYLATAEPGSGATFTMANGGEPVLEESPEGWDASYVASPSLAVVDGALWLYYEGSAGEEDASIGGAVYDDGSGLFERVSAGGEPGLVFEAGGIGDWDDRWVGTPQVRAGTGDDDGSFELFYSASDGSTVRLGRATSADGLDWTRTLVDGIAEPILGPDELGFDQEGCREPWVMDVDGRRTLWYEGRSGVDGEIPRIGLAVDRDSQVWVKAWAPLQRDDGFVLATAHGDGAPASSIDLGDDESLVVDGYLIHGSGVSDMALTPDGRFLIVTNKMYDNIYVIDVWDDSEGTAIDANYHGIEAIIQVPNHYAVTGTRGVAFADGGETMVLLLAPLIAMESSSRRYGTEAVLVLDISRIPDDSETELIDDLVVGYAATARGVEEDEGNPSIISGGPTNVVLSPDETVAYVAHYNDNSVHVYRLGAGRDPALIDVIEGLGDEPFDLVLSPDGRYLVVANYVGELEGPTQNVVHSTMTIIDVDPDSDTYHRVLTTLRNRDAW